MSDFSIIAEQWTCLTEPERQIALQMVAALPMFPPYIVKVEADLIFQAVKGTAWEIYRDQWFANWGIETVTIPIGDAEFEVYTTLSQWPFGVQACLIADECHPDVPCRCVEATGFPRPC